MVEKTTSVDTADELEWRWERSGVNRVASAFTFVTAGCLFFCCWMLATFSPGFNTYCILYLLGGLACVGLAIWSRRAVRTPLFIAAVIGLALGGRGIAVLWVDFPVFTAGNDAGMNSVGGSIGVLFASAVAFFFAGSVLTFAVQKQRTPTVYWDGYQWARFD